MDSLYSVRDWKQVSLKCPVQYCFHWLKEHIGCVSCEMIQNTCLLPILCSWTTVWIMKSPHWNSINTSMRTGFFLKQMHFFTQLKAKAWSWNKLFCLAWNADCTGWSKSLCAPDDYNLHTNYDLKMVITEYIRNVDRAILNTVFENTVRRVLTFFFFFLSSL
jgi:hypothetical protein